MKYTGIIRRLDSLGRIVIPREYRKLHKMAESDPLEILSLENGEILIKKVDLSSKLIANGTTIIEELSASTKDTAVLCDSEKFLIGSGKSKNLLVGSSVPKKISDLIADRKYYTGRASEIGLDCGGYVCVRSVYMQDSFGAIVLVSEKDIPYSDTVLVEVLASVLGSLMQNY